MKTFNQCLQFEKWVVDYLLMKQSRESHSLYTHMESAEKKVAELLWEPKGLWTWRQQVFLGELVRGGGRNQKY